ncbi:MAG: glycosyltransferase [Candidatus Cryptobacteroides sp.]
MIVALHIVLILLLVVPAVYYFVFAVAGSIKRGTVRENAVAEASRFCILIPAYMSDGFILPTVKSALDQDYPEDRFRVIVISDMMKEETDEMLRNAGAEVLRVCFENSTKAAALNAAMGYLGPGAADYVAILDSDNIVERSFLKRMNVALGGRMVAVQGHRCAKNTDTPIAMADGIFEEVNNLVFRQGHCALGLSSALIGSGMAIPYGWFAESAGGFITAGEDKEMELKLLKDGIFVEYASGIRILDEKTRSIGNLQKQRMRWLTSQYFLTGRALVDLPHARLKAGYADKLLQWAFPPRILLVAGLPLVAIVTILTRSAFMPVYAVSTLLLYTGIALGIPEWVKAGDLFAILKQGPMMLWTTLRNIFSKKTGKDKYIHTDHQ